MLWKSLLTLALIAPHVAHALIRFACSQLVIERLDPLGTPGKVSPHLHQIVGGNAFNITMDPKTGDLSELATCTSCQFKENKSNYWTAVLFFKHANGSFIRVPQMPDNFVGPLNGGMTVYYVQNGNVTAPSKGFRMITGNAMLRSTNTKAPAKITSFRCYGANWTEPNPGQPPGGGNDPVELPKQFCEGGIRAQTYFPQCWDGVNTDSVDHASHVAHPIADIDPHTGLALYRGVCPDTHPVRIPMILFETIWNTMPFKEIWPTDGSQPLVYSMGDPTGYGHHGDYIFGWEGDALQRAMNNCTAFDGDATHCKVLTTLSDDEIKKCVLKPQVNERTEGYLTALPGCNPIQDGPNPATAVPNCNAPSTTGGFDAGPTPN